MKTKTFSRLGHLVAPLSLAATMALGVSAQASAMTLGPADGYNVFVLEDVTGIPHVEGKLAAGGNVKLESFGVGNTLPSGNNGNVLVAGKDLNLKWGQVYNGDAVYGGKLTTDGVGIPQGEFKQGNPINFQEAAQELKALSSYLADLDATGTTSVKNNGGVVLEGAQSDFNIFSLAGDKLASAVDFTIDAPTESTILVNIGGSDISLGNFEFFGVNSKKVLYNFYQAETLTLNGLGIKGSILAPNAKVTFNNGNIDGQMIAGSLTRTGAHSETHNVLFEGNIPDTPKTTTEPTSVPEPATLAGLGLVAAAGVVSRRKSQQKA